MVLKLIIDSSVFLLSVFLLFYTIYMLFTVFNL